MPRANENDVLEILDGTSLDAEDVTPFLTAANLLVTQQLGSEGLGDALLKEIERWVAAHFVAAKEKQVKSETIGGVSQSYQTGSAPAGLGTTVYGERALMLDPTSRLAQMGLRRVAFGAVDYGTIYDPNYEETS